MKYVVLYIIKYIYMYGYNIQLNCIDIIIDIKILDLSYLKKIIKLCVLFFFYDLFISIFIEIIKVMW